MSEYNTFSQLQSYLNQRVVGQESLIKKLLIGLLSEGHLLVEGAPGLAKTTAIKTLSECIECNYHRVQFTPDLLPSDLTGTEVYRPQDSCFHFEPGPLFHNLLLADEINRAPAKVQSALLEAMAEKQITIGKQTYPLPDLFMVMATQNPIEQEGTYSLPEAQLDRFLMYVTIDYPRQEVERKILQLNRLGTSELSIDKPKVTQAQINAAREQVSHIHLSTELEEYLIQLVLATRQPEKYDADFSRWLRYGASPRGTISLDRCAKAHAWLSGHDYVSPNDIHAVIHDVLAHRILLSFEAEAEGVTTVMVIDKILGLVAIP